MATINDLVYRLWLIINSDVDGYCQECLLQRGHNQNHTCYPDDFKSRLWENLYYVMRDNITHDEYIGILIKFFARRLLRLHRMSDISDCIVWATSQTALYDYDARLLEYRDYNNVTLNFFIYFTYFFIKFFYYSSSCQRIFYNDY